LFLCFFLQKFQRHTKCKPTNNNYIFTCLVCTRSSRFTLYSFFEITKNMDIASLNRKLSVSWSAHTVSSSLSTPSALDEVRLGFSKLEPKAKMGVLLSLLNFDVNKKKDCAVAMKRLLQAAHTEGSNEVKNQHVFLVLLNYPSTLFRFLLLNLSNLPPPYQLFFFFFFPPFLSLLLLHSVGVLDGRLGTQ